MEQVEHTEQDRDTTWYHRHGRRYTRKRYKPVFQGTAGQQAHMSVHQRVIAVWLTIRRDTVY